MASTSLRWHSVLAATGLAVALFLQPSAQGQCTELFPLIPGSGANADQFGRDVDEDAGLAVVGAPFDDTVATNAGAVYVFQDNGTSWDEVAKLTDPSSTGGEALGMSVAIRGKVIVAGASEANSDQGQVLVFRHDGSNWVLEHTETASDGAAGDRFGESVALTDRSGDGDGDLMVVGAWMADTTQGIDTGAAYLFRDKGIFGWNEEAKLLPVQASNSDWFGRQVDIDQDRVILGGEQDDTMAFNAGTAVVYHYDGSNWIEEQSLYDPAPVGNGLLGRSVSIQGDLVVAGASGDWSNGILTGTASVFRRDPTSGVWSHEQELFPAAGATQDNFGLRVATDGVTVAVAAPYDDHSGSVNNGSVYLFRICPNTKRWGEDDWLAASGAGAGGANNDNLGIGLAFRDGVVVAGANYAATTGLAYVFNGTHLLLMADPDSGAAGQSVTWTIACAPTGTLALLVGTGASVPGVGPFTKILFLKFQADYKAVVSAVPPASLAGIWVDFQAFTIRPCGSVVGSNIKRVNF